MKLTSSTVTERITELIEKVAESSDTGTVDVLIDEYDYPLNANFQSGKFHISLGNREVLTPFYQQFKPMSPKIGMMWVTGMSRHVKAGMFAAVNDIDDMTLSPEMAQLYGYTWEEIENTFPVHLDELQKRLGMESREEVKAILTARYNGYSWDGETRVYNPWDINKALTKLAIADYWNEDGQSSVLKSMRNPLDPTHSPLYWEAKPRTTYVFRHLYIVFSLPQDLARSTLHRSKV